METRRQTLLAVALGASTLWLTSCATNPPPMDAAAVISKASAAMGADATQSLRFAATGTGTTYGQAFVPNMQWPRLNYSSFSRHYDFANSGMREEFARSRAEPNGGGALPLIGEGEQRAIVVVQGEHAWNMMGPAQVPAPVALDARIHDLWTSPHGVLKAAAKNKASAMSVTDNGKTYSVLSFSEPGRFTAKAFVNAQGLVEKIESRLPHPVMGESAVVTTYSDYSQHGASKFPMRIRQTQEGVNVLDLQVSDVQVNAPVAIAVNDVVRGFVERATSEQAAPGVWFIAGGSHNSVAIEMKDHIVMVESPLYDGRAAAAMTEVRRVIPGKPIRFMVNSHHHFDHSGGIRAAASEGATIISSAAGVPFFQQALANASTIRPDMLAKSGKKANVEGVGGKRVLSDGSRQVELHLIADSVHANGFVMVYLPAERLLIQADAYTPGAPGAAPPAKPNGNHLNLIANIEKLGLKVDRILPLHGRMVPLSELYATAGKVL
jgi:glyoxylase-like metal-dependent hydrolase (beta-lactamase superfamily II)